MKFTQAQRIYRVVDEVCHALVASIYQQRAAAIAINQECRVGNSSSCAILPYLAHPVPSAAQTPSPMHYLSVLSVREWESAASAARSPLM